MAWPLIGSITSRKNYRHGQRLSRNSRMYLVNQAAANNNPARSFLSVTKGHPCRRWRISSTCFVSVAALTITCLSKINCASCLRGFYTTFSWLSEQRRQLRCNHLLPNSSDLKICNVDEYSRSLLNVSLKERHLHRILQLYIMFATSSGRTCRTL